MSKLRYTYSEAVNYCESLSLGGRDDWRVPTRKEYSTVFNFGRTSPALDTTYFPYYTTAVNGWTASPYQMDPTKMWAVLISWGTMFPERHYKSLQSQMRKRRCGTNG